MTNSISKVALSIVQSILERNDQDIQRGYKPSIVHEGLISRPRFDVSRSQLACLLQGHLLARGIRVQQQRVRESQKSTLLYANVSITSMCIVQ